MRITGNASLWYLSTVSARNDFRPGGAMLQRAKGAPPTFDLYRNASLVSSEVIGTGFDDWPRGDMQDGCAGARTLPGTAGPVQTMGNSHDAFRG